MVRWVTVILSVLENTVPFIAVKATKSTEECRSLCPPLPVPVCKSEELLCLLKSSRALVQFISAALLPFTPSDCADTAIDQGKGREGGRLRTGDAWELIIPVFQLLQEWVAKCKVGKRRKDKRGNRGTVLKSKREWASQRKALKEPLCYVWFILSPWQKCCEGRKLFSGTRPAARCVAQQLPIVFISALVYILRLFTSLSELINLTAE